MGLRNALAYTTVAQIITVKRFIVEALGAGATTFSITTPGITTLSIMGLFATLRINDTQHK
jgi:hypothetical protein